MSRMCTRLPVRNRRSNSCQPPSCCRYATSQIRPTPKIGHGSGYVSLLLGPWTLVLRGGLFCTVQFQDALALSLPSACWNSTDSQYSSGSWHIKQPRACLVQLVCESSGPHLGREQGQDPHYSKGLATEGATRS